MPQSLHQCESVSLAVSLRSLLQVSLVSTMSLISTSTKFSSVIYFNDVVSAFTPRYFIMLLLHTCYTGPHRLITLFLDERFQIVFVHIRWKLVWVTKRFAHLFMYLISLWKLSCPSRNLFATNVSMTFLIWVNFEIRVISLSNRQ